ncbi:MAG: MFS transporter [bacterium]|nr:MFS transporter [bacterium]
MFQQGMLRAFKHRNYRVFFIGQFFSLIGTWISSIACGWLVFRLTHSEFLLGVVSFAGQFPSVLVAPFAGVLVDRWDRQKVLICTQCASMLQSLSLAILTLTGVIGFWSICALSLVQALINAFDMPARQIFVGELMEDKADLPNAIALNSAMFNGARLLGPAIGGFLIAFSNEGICFLIDAISYLAVLISLFSIVPMRTITTRARENILLELKAGVKYVYEHQPIKELLFLVGLIGFFATSHLVLMPVFAHEIFQAGPKLLGLLMAASGLGALSGALILAKKYGVAGFGSLITRSSIFLGISLIGFSYVTLLAPSLFFIFASGASMVLLLASCNTLIQTLVKDEMKGRVMSIYFMSFMGMMPLGNLAAGMIANHFGASHTVFISGVCCLLVTIHFVRKLPEIRRRVLPIEI